MRARTGRRIHADYLSSLSYPQISQIDADYSLHLYSFVCFMLSAFSLTVLSSARICVICGFYLFFVFPCSVFIRASRNKCTGPGTGAWLLAYSIRPGPVLPGERVLWNLFWNHGLSRTMSPGSLFAGSLKEFSWYSRVLKVSIRRFTQIVFLHVAMFFFAFCAFLSIRSPGSAIES